MDVLAAALVVAVLLAAVAAVEGAAVCDTAVGTLNEARLAVEAGSGLCDVATADCGGEEDEEEEEAEAEDEEAGTGPAELNEVADAAGLDAAVAVRGGAATAGASFPAVSSLPARCLSLEKKDMEAAGGLTTTTTNCQPALSAASQRSADMTEWTAATWQPSLATSHGHQRGTTAAAVQSRAVYGRQAMQGAGTGQSDRWG